jgi:hypothetical protein
VRIGYICHDIEKFVLGHIRFSTRSSIVSSDNPGYTMINYVRMVKNGQN